MAAKRIPRKVSCFARDLLLLKLVLEKSAVSAALELVEKVTKQAGEKAPDAREPPEG